MSQRQDLQELQKWPAASTDLIQDKEYGLATEDVTYDLLPTWSTAG